MRIALPTLVNLGVGRRCDELADLVARVARTTEADLVVLPELAVSGYPEMADADAERGGVEEVSEPVDGPSGEVFRALARELSCAIVYGVSERPDGGSGNDVIHNTLVLADPGGTLSAYRKVHLTTAERRVWAPGEGIGLTGSALGVVGLSACNDKAFPAVYDQQRDGGAGLSIIASAWSSYPGSPTVSGDVWAELSELFDRSRAAETGMVVVSTNYSGPRVPGSADCFCDGRRVVDSVGRLVAPVQISPEVLVWDVSVETHRSVLQTLHGTAFFGRT